MRVVEVWRHAVAGLLLTVALGGPASAQPTIVWEVENPFRFFLDPADTEVHRATWVSLSPEQRRSPVLSAERLLAARHAEGWSASMFDKTCWDGTSNRYICREKPDYINPKSHTVRASLQGLADAQVVDCTWLTAPRGRGERGKAVTLPCDTPVQLEIPYPAGVLDQGGDRRPAGRRGRRPRNRSLHRRHGGQFCLRRGQSRCAGAVLAGPHRGIRRERQQRCAQWLSGSRGRLEGDRRKSLHRGKCALAGPGVPSLAVFASTSSGASAQRRGSASRRDVRRRCLLGRGDRVRRFPALQGARMGAQPAGVLANLRRCGGAVRRQRCARLRTARGLSHQRQDPRPEGRPGAEEMRCRQGAQDRPAVPVDRRQRHRLRAAGRQRGAGRQLNAAPAGRLVRPGAMGLPRPACSWTSWKIA